MRVQIFILTTAVVVATEERGTALEALEARATRFDASYDRAHDIDFFVRYLGGLVSSLLESERVYVRVEERGRCDLIRLENIGRQCQTFVVSPGGEERRTI